MHQQAVLVEIMWCKTNHSIEYIFEFISSTFFLENWSIIAMPTIISQENSGKCCYMSKLYINCISESLLVKTPWGCGGVCMVGVGVTP